LGGFLLGIISMDDENDSSDDTKKAGAVNTAKASKHAPSLLDAGAAQPVRRSLKSHVRAVRDAHFLPTGSKPGARKKVLLKNTVLRVDQLHADDAHAMIESGDLLDFDPAPPAPTI
jgi:hypothetical protein